jgi:hypothetical protein
MKRLQARYIILLHMCHAYIQPRCSVYQSSCIIYTAMHTYHYDSAKLVRIVMPPPAPPATPTPTKSEFNIGFIQCLIEFALAYGVEMYNGTMPTILAMFTDEFLQHKKQASQSNALYIQNPNRSEIEAFAKAILLKNMHLYAPAGNQEGLILANFITGISATIMEIGTGNAEFYRHIFKNPVVAMAFIKYAVIEYTELGERLQARLVKLMNDENAKNITRTMDSLYTP